MCYNRVSNKGANMNFFNKTEFLIHHKQFQKVTQALASIGIKAKARCYGERAYLLSFCSTKEPDARIALQDLNVSL